jgi:glycosyltransferase involved in cell wall biosynthesis
MKKILILNPYIPTLGGGEKHMGYLCRFLELRYTDVEIEILVHNYNDIDVFSPSYITIADLNRQFNLDLQKTTIKKLTIGNNATPLGFLKYKRQIESITSKYDLFVNFMYFSKHYGRAKKNIYSCMFPPQKFISDSRFEKSFGYRLLAKHLDAKFTNSYDVFISNSQFTNHWLREFWGKGLNQKIIYPPVFEELEIKNRFSLSEKKNIILSVGRFFVNDHNKKQDILVDFFIRNYNLLKNTEFHLIGALSNNPVDVKYVEGIKEKIKGFPITLHINAPFIEVMQYYREAKIFWHATGCDRDENIEPDKMEHFGITTVEAMSFGAVPIVVNKGGQKEIVENGVSGYLWNSEKDCIDSTLKVLETPDLYEKMSMAAHHKSYSYSIEQFYNNNKLVFDEL